jgi:hypothetical protein
MCGLQKGNSNFELTIAFSRPSKIDKKSEWWRVEMVNANENIPSLFETE